MVRNASWALVLVISLGTASAAEVEVRRAPSAKENFQLSRNLAREAESRERLKIAPRFVDEEIDGFVVQELDDAPTLARLGFHEGDVIRRVDGRRLDSPETVLAIRASLHERQAPFDVVVELERGGLAVTRTIHVT